MNADKNPQTGTFSYIGLRYYSLTWCCYERQSLFEQRDRVDLVRAQLLRASAETNVVNIAYCFMPDHLHQVVKGQSVDADAKAYISKAKQYSAYYFNQKFHTRLWARKGFNRVLAPDDDPRTAVKYVLGNPLKANLVARIEDHPFSGSETHTWQELIDWAYHLGNRSHDDGSD
jgi:REP element-mobilizing transposase RayT